VTHGSPVHFVSDNKEDFADTSDAKVLHPDLLEDCKTRGIEVIYHRNLDSLLDSLSKKVNAAPSIDSVSCAHEILLEALFSSGLPHRISDEYHSSRSFVIDLKVADIRKIKSHQVDDAILSLVTLHLDVDTELADETDPPKVLLSVECRAWIQSNSATGAISTIDIEEIANLQTR
jgi:hypothetical protein